MNANRFRRPDTFRSAVAAALLISLVSLRCPLGPSPTSPTPRPMPTKRPLRPILPLSWTVPPNPMRAFKPDAPAKADEPSKPEQKNQADVNRPSRPRSPRSVVLAPSDQRRSRARPIGRFARPARNWPGRRRDSPAHFRFPATSRKRFRLPASDPPATRWENIAFYSRIARGWPVRCCRSTIRPSRSTSRGSADWKIDRDKLQRMYRMDRNDSPALVYVGPQGLDGWLTTGPKRPGKASAGRLGTERPHSGLLRNFGGLPQACYEIDISGQRPPNFSIAFGVDLTPECHRRPGRRTRAADPKPPVGAFFCETWGRTWSSSAKREHEADFVDLECRTAGRRQSAPAGLRRPGQRPHDRPLRHRQAAGRPDRARQQTASRQRHLVDQQVGQSQAEFAARQPLERRGSPGRLAKADRQQLGPVPMAPCCSRPSARSMPSGGNSRSTVATIATKSFDEDQLEDIFSPPRPAITKATTTATKNCGASSIARVCNSAAKSFKVEHETLWLECPGIRRADRPAARHAQNHQPHAAIAAEVPKPPNSSAPRRHGWRWRAW